jgi:alpha-aminoadipic semialdehyde synthase
MARTVGQPAAIAVRLLVRGELPLTGCRIPTHPAIYEPILAELEATGLGFQETIEEIAEETS